MGNIGRIENFFVGIPVRMCWVESRHHPGFGRTSSIGSIGMCSSSSSEILRRNGWSGRNGGKFHKAIDRSKGEEPTCISDENKQPHKEDNLPSCQTSTNSSLFSWMICHKDTP